VRTTVALVALLCVLSGCIGGQAPAPERTYTLETPDAATATPAPEPGTLEVHFIDVGHADSTLVVGPSGKTMLVDTGRDPNATAVRAYLARENIEEIDVLFSTHPDATSIGGQAAIINTFEREKGGIDGIGHPGITRETRAYNRYLRAVIENELQHEFYDSGAGEQVGVDGFSIDILHPPEQRLADGDDDENSIVLRIGYRNTSVLLPGDIGPAGQEELLETQSDEIDTTVLKTSQRGAAASTDPAFLDAVSPQVAVVSAGESERRRPGATTFSRLAAVNASTYWTARHGTIVVESDGESVAAETERPAPNDATAYVRSGNRTAQAGA
jgi:competence protein ComEC